MKKLTLIILFLSIFLPKTHSQKEISVATGLNNNSIQLNIGYLLLYGTININYERVLKQYLWDKNISSFAKIGIGFFGNFGGTGGYTSAQLGILTGENKHHLEISGGVCLNVPKFGWGDDPIGFPIAANVGWRIQKPGNHFIFRLGAGLPESIYFGLGFSF